MTRARGRTTVRSARPRPPPFDDLLEGLTASNALERVARACGDCPAGLELYQQFRTLALCSHVGELEIRATPQRSPVDELVRVFAVEFLRVLNLFRRRGGQWRATGPKAFRGFHHVPRPPERVDELELQRWLALDATGAHDVEPEPVSKRQHCSKAEQLGTSLAGRVKRQPRTLHDHFRLFGLARVLHVWVPPRTAKDAVLSKVGGFAYAIYALFGVIPREILRRLRAARELLELEPVADVEAPPPRDELRAELEQHRPGADTS